LSAGLAASAENSTSTLPAAGLVGGPASPQSRAAASHFLTGLGHAGLGDTSRAREELTAALAAAPDLLVARLALDQL
jgi:hypothetical protein